MTKRLAVMGSGSGSNFEAIVKFFKNEQIEIVCISDNKDAYILKRAEKLGIKNLYLPYEKNAVYFKENKFDLGVLAGYMRILDKETLALCKFVNIHPSLLPSFKGKNAIERAYAYGVKVSGVTVHHVDESTDGGKIIAQFPVIIDETMNLSDFESEIHALEHKLYPPVIKSILDDQLFSFDMLLKSDQGHSGGCGGCGGVREVNKKAVFLVFGSGAREHAIAQKLSESEYTAGLFLALPNDGFAGLGEVIGFENYDDLAKKAVQKGVDILVVGPENPLCEGITDVFKKYGIKCIGVDKKWSRLESSKYFAKKFMEKHGIKTAKYEVINEYNQILRHFQNDSFFADSPYVIKADGLCKGKGVKIAKSKDEASKTAKEYLDGKFGDESSTLLVEEFLEGEEFSLMSLWDGKNLLSFLPARDFKRLGADPQSPNTGGMGAFCPVVLTAAQSVKLEQYEKRLKHALTEESADFTGFIYSGLIWSRDDFWVLEYNVRLGDPETQAILTHLDSDSGEIFIKAVEQKLDEVELKWNSGTSACLVLAADTYPEKSSVGEKISGLPEKDVFFAGVKKCGNELQTNGGRILSVCKTGRQPFEEAKQIAQKIKFKGKYYREDLTQPSVSTSC